MATLFQVAHWEIYVKIDLYVIVFRNFSKILHIEKNEWVI